MMKGRRIYGLGSALEQGFDLGRSRVRNAYEKTLTEFLQSHQ